MTRIVIDGREIEADPKKPLVAACHAAGADVPTYCYHPGLSPVGSCRICQVEVKQGDGPPRVVVACRTPVAEGMRVDTEAPKAHQLRRECLEFLLKNHPLDCPICDKAGECDLQDFAYDEGQDFGRTVEPRRKLDKRKSLGEVIVLDEERCILCSRCVRFFEEVTHKPQLTVADIGARSVIATFAERPLSGKYQGNIADLCPVGALTLAPFRFQARVWNLLKAASTCAECSRGCSIKVEVLRRGDVKRFRPRENLAVNRWWMCDIGRFAFEPVDGRERLPGALLRGPEGLEGARRSEAFESARDVLVVHERPLVVVSPFLTVEEGALALALCETLGAEPLFVSPPDNGEGDELLHTGDPCPNRRGLSELGFAARAPEELQAALAEREASLLIGERVADLVGREALAALPATHRLILIDGYPLDAACVKVAFGAPLWVERTGTWINVDGHRGPIAAARPAPAGVAPLDETLGLLSDVLRASGARHEELAR